MTCGRIYAPSLAPRRCAECRSELPLLELVDALALARGRQDRLRRERVRRLAGADFADPSGTVIQRNS
jgi:hypothetical protein